MEEIFQDMVMTTTIMMMKTTMMVSDLMIINMLKCSAGATCARRNASLRRDAFGCSCSKRVMHVKCLSALGRTKPECLNCDEIKVKPYPRGGGGGDDPNPYDHDD
eukprot:6467680-Amphidinium_carterae.1